MVWISLEASHCRPHSQVNPALPRLVKAQVPYHHQRVKARHTLAVQSTDWPRQHSWGHCQPQPLSPSNSLRSRSTRSELTYLVFKVPPGGANWIGVVLRIKVHPGQRTSIHIPACVNTIRHFLLETLGSQNIFKFK